MPPSYYNAPKSTRDHFAEHPTIFGNLITALRTRLAIQAQRQWERYRKMSLSTIQADVYRSFRHAQRMWTLRRLLSLPHLCVALWVVVLFWGERWVFQSSVQMCKWDNWEKWPQDATPHHLVFIADPQLIDPHTYPDRPWPLSTFTIWHTDNYLKRSYIQLQKQLQPDTLFFLGDLFDGGREWKTERGDSSDPAWAAGFRPAQERSYLKLWRRKYGEEYWLREYNRFGRIFYEFFGLGGTGPRPGQRGRRIISSLPGNHDLGFGAQIKLPVRDRFEAYFGEGNRVDVIGNHTFVSVDSVSLSAANAEHKAPETTRGLIQPVEDFLSNVQALKRKAVTRELSFQAGHEKTLQFGHVVEDLRHVNFYNLPTIDPGPGAPDFPTVLLTHVPLYRGPGTPCGPNRERWPPTPPPKGQTTPVSPDERNALPLGAGYQYQTVLGEEESVRLVSTIGNVVSVFSGDDHDYCEIVHSENKNHAREITVKSMSWAMGVRKPGFVMVSMWNPVSPDGKALQPVRASPSAAATMENHQCLLPDQLGIFIRYGIVLAITLIALITRAMLTPILNLEPFSDSIDFDDGPVLPAFSKDIKRDMDVHNDFHQDKPSTSSTSSTNSSNLAPRTSAARTRSVSPAVGYGLPAGQARNATPPPLSAGGYGYGYAPDTNKNSSTAYGSMGKQKKAAGTGGVLGLVWREAWTSVWRTTWIVFMVYFYLIWYG